MVPPLRPFSNTRSPTGPLAATLGLTLIVLLSVVGCGAQELESGYAYRPLNSSTVERRAFYADPYSLEARRAETEKSNDNGGTAPGRQSQRPGIR